MVKASNLIKDGEIVAIPTETVYGIAGNAFDGSAIKKIFTAKGRPQDNPLIVHVNSKEMLKDVVKSVSLDAEILTEKFWPGPLTVILPKGEKVAKETCAGLDSVGVRMPAHPVALELIRLSGVPFAAPSANVSGKPSPTSAKDVFSDMDGRLPLVIDGGDCLRGVESTVISLLTDTPVILRPGYITKQDIEEVLNKEVILAKAVTEGVKEGEEVLSPGMKYKHYAPNADVTIIKGSLEEFKAYVTSKRDENVYCLCFDGEEFVLPFNCVCYGKEGDGASQAKNLFSALRRLDELGAKTVYARCPKEDGVGLAVYNRLIRAAGFKLLDLSKG